MTRSVRFLSFAYAALAVSLLVPAFAEARSAAAAPATPVLVGQCENPPRGYVYASALPVATDRLAAPPVTAASAAVIDGETGRILLNFDAHRRLPPASTTKILTAALTLEDGDLDRVVTSATDARAMVGSSVMGLVPGMPITIRDLLYGLLLPSGNDAAVELSRAVAGDRRAFVAMMNAKVRTLGLTNTHFENPHGLDSPGQFSSAYDLAMIARYAMSNPQFAGMVGARVRHLPPPLDYDIANGNTLLGAYPGADGVKVGWTEAAGWTFVASATHGGHRVFVALMDTKDRDGDAAHLLDWAWQAFSWVDVTPGVGRALRLASRLGIWSSAMGSLGACG